jgi:hypothetical protein
MSINHHAIRINILHILQQAGEFKMPDDALKKHLRKLLDVVPSQLSDAEIDRELEWLKAKAWIDWTIEGITEEKRWAITASGKATI